MMCVYILVVLVLLPLLPPQLLLLHQGRTCLVVQE